ncbi:pilus assembly protein [Cupriavidus sp. 2KB_3]|uniref:pilus assembly protein n=1 Tax=Cupriavidus sp. 2KB_3 TaxID=3232980 RepID=UPI003F924AC3
MKPFLPHRPASRLQAVLLAASFLLAVASASAAQLNLSTKPLYAGGGVSPMVMIDLSKDHSLHQKAYNDYSDLDGDGILDSTYSSTISYAGYFDSAKCYSYDSSSIQGFVPAAMADSAKYCDGTKWSGNFLNWVSMSRIDEVRKILYGGTRAVDTATTTVLERAFLPMDAHAWAKYYGGADLRKLVPVDLELPSEVETQTSSTQITLRADVVTLTVSDNSKMQIGDQIRLVPRGSAPAGTSLTGWISSIGNSNAITMAIYADSVSKPASASNSYSSWTVTNLTRGGLTICNVTPKDSSNLNSQANTQAPQLRVVKGNYATWGASEKWQCNWYSEASNTQSSFLPQTNGKTVSGSSNGNRAATSGINASAENPSQSVRGTGTGQAKGTFNARVQACVTGLIGGESCKQYGNAYKPYGLLQKYGETGQMLFGLMTGTYDKNISGGVLRQNVTNFSTEINPDSGVFTYRATTPVKGIVWNIDKLRPYGYSYSDGGYTSADSCNYQQTAIQPSGGQNAQNKPANEGNCSTWGNPISEIYVETLRYFAGKTANADFAPKTNGKDVALGLTTATWANPMNLPASNPKRAPYCSPLNALVFNSSVSSYDNDQLGGLSDLAGSPAISDWTNKVGAGEGIDNGNWFAGGISGGIIDNVCSAKKVGSLSNVLGICPEGPSQKGTFQIAGAALFAHMNRIRTDIDVTSADETTRNAALKVSTYAVQLATNTPKINVNVGGKTVTIMPSYQLHPTNVDPSTGTLVDFKVISQDASSGRFYVSWEDSVAGGDYDQDVWGILSYSVTGGNITVSTKVVSGSSSNGQGFGYVVSGTDKDGPHFHSGIYGFNYTDPTGVKGCSNCNLGDAETSVTYSVTGNSGSQFLDPLQYAAKWGGFKDGDGDKTPNKQAEWDVRLSNGDGGSDGLPDNYFYATNPGALSAALERAFISILATSSSSSVAASSSRLDINTRSYQARFNGSDWSGQLFNFALDTKGETVLPAIWDAGQTLRSIAPTNRAILTYNSVDADGRGIPFRYTSLPTDFQTIMTTGGADGTKRVNWLRGDQSNEGDASGKFRARPTTILGDIVNSSPQYVGPPNAGYAGNDYAEFVLSKRSRKPVLYVGANDGMMHAFSAKDEDGGKELFAYVPSLVYSKLPTLTNLDYVHTYTVDGTPAVKDAKINSAWRTVLVSGLGLGGRGVFALDVTDPESVSESTAASTVLWEFPSSADADLGHVVGQPKIVKMSNGKWVAIFGNGFNSTAGHGSIFIVYLDRVRGSKRWTLGTDYLKLTLDDATATASNGIASVLPADVNGDGTVDFLYAGDLLGNLWKFDVTDKTDSKWQSTRKLMFTAKDSAGNRQPITGQPDVARNPTGGYMVVFGTGRYVDNSDPSNFSTQTLYGIWDQNITAQGTITRSMLQEQKTLSAGVAYGKPYRITTDTKVQLTAGGIQGWYMDLLIGPTYAQLGERMVTDALIRGKRVVLITMTPSTEVCDSGGSSFVYEVGTFSGARLDESPVDLNGDGKIDANDTVNGVVVSGIGSTVGITPKPPIIDCGPGKECKLMSGSSGGTQTITESADKPSGRLSWREILH